MEADLDEDYDCKECNNSGSRVYQLPNGEWEVEKCYCLVILQWCEHLEEFDAENFGVDETYEAI